MTLATLIASRKEQLLATWLARVQRATAGIPASLSRPELIDSLPAFLDELAAALGQDRALESTPLAAEHGEQRLRAGFDIATVVREYEVLREAALELAGREQVPLAPEEVALLVKSLFAGAQRAAAQYVQARDADSRRRDAEHLGFIAHELRTPLGSAQMALLLLGGREELARDRTFGALTRAVAQLRRLVDHSLSDVTARSLGRLRLQRVSLAELLAELHRELELDAEARRQRVELRADEATLIADPLVLRSAVLNLLVNAMKFSPEGSTIVVQATAADEGISIRVRDHCGGLPPGRPEDLFAPFVQAGADRSGYGLGLAIARQAAEAHGGALHAQDLPGTGCVFELSLPYTPDPRREGPAPSAPSPG
jgi:signal transduction histidine kinase